MHLSIITKIFIIGFLFSACTQHTPIERSEIEALLDEYSKALSSKSAAKIAAVFHENAIILPEGKTVVKGTASIVENFKELEKLDFEEKFEIQEILPAGEIAIIQTQNIGRWSNPENGEQAQFSVKGQMVLKKDNKGQLKIFRYAYNSNPTKQLAQPIPGEFMHVVYFWLKTPDSQEDRDAFLSSLTNFIEHSENINSKHIGMPADTDRSVIDNTYTFSLILSFDSKEEQDKYQEEAGHLQFIEESESLWEKVLVYDSERL